MTVRWLLASFHLLALGIGMGAIAVRWKALRGELDEVGIRRVLAADTAWGLAALLWISSGLIRAFGGIEKGTDFYLDNSAFQYKMLFLATILLLEIWPMVTFIRWRIARSRAGEIDTSRSRLFSTISAVQMALIILMVFAATAVARGMGN